MNTAQLLVAAGTVVACTTTALWADESHWHAARVDGHAPLGVMGDHTHHAGEWMASYRYMYMDMSGNRDGSRRVSTAEVLDSYMVAPESMTMDMHMLGGMFAPTDDLTITLMVPYVEKSMDHVTRMGRQFTTETSGIGDITLGGLYDIAYGPGYSFHVNAGIGFPTGGIDEKGDTPAGRARLPYPMQLGSGTYDLKPGLTYLGQVEKASWGAQALYTYRLDENDNDYSLGDRFDISLWASMIACKYSSFSVRLLHTDWDDVEGADPALNPAMVPTADPDLRGGNRTDLGLGINLLGTEGLVKGHRLALEVLVPIRQDLDGPQLEADWSFVMGWQRAF